MATKIITALELLQLSKLKFKYILKSDDDVYIDFENLLPFVYFNQNINFGGHVFEKLGTRRNANDKWFLSKAEYPSDVIPYVVLGVANILNRAIIDKLLEFHRLVPILPMEDIYITELVLKSGFNLTDIPHLKYCPRIFTPRARKKPKWQGN
ncbi:hypothetical protein MXB_1278 [Myxobolus squamalis]|nr:hypothetical protein MXB_1278 [Myxobolus squamalis]